MANSTLNIPWTQGDGTLGSNITGTVKWFKVGRIISFEANLTTSASISADDTIISGLPQGLSLTNFIPVLIFDNTNGTFINGVLTGSGEVRPKSAIASGHSLRMSTAYHDL